MARDDLSLVLRDVQLDLSEKAIVESLGVATASRFMRTAARPPRPLLLVRVECQSSEQREQLLADGSVLIRGTRCAIEEPQSLSSSTAAKGKAFVQPEELEVMLRQLSLGTASLAAALYPEDLALRPPQPGEHVFCSRGRFHRGALRTPNQGT